MTEDKGENGESHQEAADSGAALQSVEGRIFLLGLIMALLYSGWLALTYLGPAEQSHVLVGMTAMHVFFGRAAGIAAGFASDFDQTTVVVVNLIIETIMVLLFYPLFVFSWRQLLVFRPLKKLMNRIQQTAESNQHIIRRYGLPGLFLFVCIPFWMTGPLIGSAIGFLMGLRPWVNMTVVLGGTYLATVALAVFLRELNERLSHFTGYAPLIVLAALVLVAIVGFLLNRKRKNNNSAS